MNEQQNVVLVTIDSLRADHCSYMGYERETTPTLDRLAADGLSFRNAVAPGPSTSESMPAIFTGEYPFTRGVSDTSIDERIGRIEPHLRAQETLAEQFSAAGYATAAFTPNPFTTRYFGFDEGFDHYQDFLSGTRDKLYEQLFQGPLQGSQLYMPLRIGVNWLKREEAFKPWEDYYDEVLDWIDSAEEPYFVWIFLMDVHHPYTASSETRTDPLWRNLYANYKLRAQDYQPPFSESVQRSLVRAYDDSIEYADAFLERLCTDVIDDDTGLVVTADHGEAFGEHDIYEHHGGAFGQHGEQEFSSYLYEENIHVPLVAYNMGETGRVDDPVSLRSLGDLLDPAGEVDRSVTDDFVSAQTISGDQIALRGRRWKYIRDGADRTVYDLDRNEQTPVEDEELLDLLDRLGEVRLDRYRQKQNIVDAARTVAAESDV